MSTSAGFKIRSIERATTRRCRLLSSKDAVRGWSDEYSVALAEQLARAPATAHVSLGDLLVPSGALALSWAPESIGKSFEIDDASMGRTSFLVKVAHQRFTCADERTVTGETSARRLVLEGVRSGTTSS